MRKKNCSSLCYCCNRNRLTKSQFSKLFFRLEKIYDKKSPFDKALIDKSIFRFRYDFPLGRFITSLALYVLPAKLQFKKAMSSFKKENQEIYKDNFNQIRILKNFAADDPSFSHSFRIRTPSMRFFDSEIFAKLPEIINEMLALMGKIKSRKLLVKECVAFSFKEEEVNMRGGLTLPMRIFIDKELTKRTGEASIHGFDLHVEKSPLRLTDVRFFLNKKELRVRVIALPYLQISRETPKEVYDHSLRMIKLFVEGRE